MNSRNLIALGTLSRNFAAALALLGACGSAPAQSFVNLDFEGIRPGGVAPDGIWLSWNLAAPGWTRPRGGDSVFVYHNTPPRESIAQWYFLVDSTSREWSPLQGDYSLALVSGHYNRDDATSPWMQAYIEQQGYIPAGTRSLRLMADGEVTLSLNSTPIPLVRENDYYLAGDISEFAGEFATLRITSQATALQNPVLVDGIQFSLQPIPEASPSQLLLCGLGVFFAHRMLRRNSAPQAHRA